MGSRKKSDDVSLGKFISLILRHKPEEIGIKLDSEGWADVRELLKGINAAGMSIDMETLERIVAENNKKRYTLSPDKKRIRANQGHSLSYVNIEMEQRTPPALLYHGTGARFLGSIKAEGIKKMSRQYVHLSPDIPTAANVGRRHGKPAVLVIDAAKMAEDGYVFMISANGVWQSEDIPWSYVREVISPENGE